jgi:hypothetical protein
MPENSSKWNTQSGIYRRLLRFWYYLKLVRVAELFLNRISIFRDIESQYKFPIICKENIAKLMMLIEFWHLPDQKF